MKLLIITPPILLEGEISFLIRLFENGLETLHLRKPGWGMREVNEYLEKIPVEFYERIMLHDHFELASSFNLKGIHFSEKEKENLDKWKKLPGLRSWAVHEEDELLNLPVEVDYVLLSPVFPSISKPDYTGKLNLKKVTGWLNAQKVAAKIYGLGGVEAVRIPELKEMGFDGAALLGAVWNPFQISPEKGFNNWTTIKEACREI